VEDVSPGVGWEREPPEARHVEKNMAPLPSDVPIHRRVYLVRVRLSNMVILSLLLVASAACTGQEAPPPVPAPNLISPATVPVARGMNGECFVGILRAPRVKPAEVTELLGPRAPTWLPGGFGLFASWDGTGEGGSYGAVWTDETCRQVTLEVWPNAAGAESPMPDGRWVLSSAATCTYAAVRNVRCLNYDAQVGGDALSLQLVDLTQQEAIRVVTGIHI
jgi:hypothetical protein